ncbi:hypothetical protein [Fulvivirga sedimenti]|nr:hypothetical protein [Fulvivirga sedimenti]
MLKKLIRWIQSVVGKRPKETPEETPWLDRSKTLNGWADRK